MEYELSRLWWRVTFKIRLGQTSTDTQVEESFFELLEVHSTSLEHAELCDPKVSDRKKIAERVTIPR